MTIQKHVTLVSVKVGQRPIHASPDLSKTTEAMMETPCESQIL
jgi:hypothetical protein